MFGWVPYVPLNFHFPEFYLNFLYKLFQTYIILKFAFAREAKFCFYFLLNGSCIFSFQ